MHTRRLAALATSLLWSIDSPIVCIPPATTTQWATVVAFCGTQNWKDLLIDDLDIRPAPWPEVKRSKDAAAVHGGFARRTRRLLKAKSEFFETHDRFVLVGHSLGGSCSILCASELKRRGKDVHAVITFGTPYLASRRFQRFYADQGLWGKTTNYYTPQDPVVTRIPHFYRRAGRYLRLEYNGTDPWEHHDIQTYHALLEHRDQENAGRAFLQGGTKMMGTNLLHGAARSDVTEGMGLPVGGSKMKLSNPGS